MNKPFPHKHAQVATVVVGHPLPVAVELNVMEGAVQTNFYPRYISIRMRRRYMQ